MTFIGNPRGLRRSQARKFYLLALPLWLCTLAAAQAPTFVSFDAPDAGLGQALGTHPLKINRNGVIAGWYLDSHVVRSEEHTSELQSQSNLVCRLLLEKKKKKRKCRQHS